MDSFRPSNPVARSLINFKPLPSDVIPDHPTKRCRTSHHSGVTLPKVKPFPALNNNILHNKVVPMNNNSSSSISSSSNNNKTNQFEHALAVSPLIPSPRKLGDSTSVSSVPNLSRGPQIAPVDFNTNSSRFRPIRKLIFSRVYPLCQTKRKHEVTEVPETDGYSEDEAMSYMDVEPQYLRMRRSSYEPGRSSSHADLGREISMSPLARIISSMPEITNS